jgi:hypothetical protein
MNANEMNFFLKKQDIEILSKEELIFKNVCEMRTLNPDLLNIIKILKIYKDVYSQAIKKNDILLVDLVTKKQVDESIFNELIVDVDDFDVVLNDLDERLNKETDYLKEEITKLKNKNDHFEKLFVLLNNKLKGFESKFDKLVFNCEKNTRDSCKIIQEDVRKNKVTSELNEISILKYLNALQKQNIIYLSLVIFLALIYNVSFFR